jgi:glycine cleavage system T protein (aminomethyltransferase)
MAETRAEDALKQTPLAALHLALGARMVPFAGYAMPVQYPSGILAEHRHVREAAGLFDVSHMGQAVLVGPDHQTTAAALEALAPGDFLGLAAGRIRYTLLTNADGGIIDDLMVTRPPGPEGEGCLKIVVNAARKDVDYAHIRANLPLDVELRPDDSRALVALQGPKAADIVVRIVAELADMAFMTERDATIAGVDCTISRSGYTGEDGFEISMPGDRAEAVARALLADPAVLPIGLGARDSLRLEAGLPLYGHDIDETTSPVEADLVFAVSKRRREEGGFPGADRILRELRDGPPRRRVGMIVDGRAPAREGVEIREAFGRPVGIVTSGGYGATVGGPIAMGYVETALSEPGTDLTLAVRGKDVASRVTTLPFVPHRYFRKPKDKVTR